jgi:peptidoglycan/LPS O-acetylase OafA/YrhL
LYLTNVRVALDGWIPSGMLGHFWSLAVEEQFYLFWPVVVLLCRRRTLILVCLAIMASSLLLRVALHDLGNSTAAYVLTPARFDSLAVGAILAMGARTPGGLARWRRPALVLMGLSAIGVAAMAITYRGFPAEAYLIGTAGYSLLAILFGGLVLTGVTAPASALWARLLSSGTLRMFGRYSYALYVIHQPVLFLLPVWWSVDSWAPYLGSWLMAYVAFAISATALCLGLALLSWHLLEDRFLRLKDRFAHDAGNPVPSRHVTPLNAAPN